MRKFIEYAVKLILIVLVLMGYQAFKHFTESQAAAHYEYLSWGLFAYAALVFSYILIGMILAYNERRSGKAAVTKFVLFVIAVYLIGFPFSSILGTVVSRNYGLLSELVRVLSILFGILLTGLKL